MKLQIRRSAAVIGLVLLLFVLLVRYALSLLKSMEPEIGLHFEINTSWDSRPLDHRSVHLSLFGDTKHGLIVEVDAPFFNDPSNPGGEPGQPFQGLWEFEVVEVFFLNDENQYLEVEFCPHGQHLVLLLSDVRKPFKDMLNLSYSAVINENSWKGKAVIPWEYLPEKITKFNAYAIHGSGTGRIYESLFSVPQGKYSSPDFHRLDYFQRVDFKTVIPEEVPANHLSKLWKNH